MFRYVLAWFPMLVIAVANGALRRLALERVLSELRAHQVSTVIGSGLIGAFVWLLVRAWPPASGAEAFEIGLIWLALTVAFECFMGLVLLRLPPAQVLADYNLLAGRLWPLFLAWLTVAPWLFLRFRPR